MAARRVTFARALQRLPCCSSPPGPPALKPLGTSSRAIGPQVRTGTAACPTVPRMPTSSTAARRPSPRREMSVITSGSAAPWRCNRANDRWQPVPANQYVGYSGTGTFTQSGGIDTVSSLSLGYCSGSSGTFNLNGGMLIVSAISGGSGTAALNFNGGTLEAGTTLSTSVPINLTTSGGNGTINTAGYAVTLSGPLSGPGGLIKTDSGTLTLSAANTYGGPTLVSGGTLNLANSGALQLSTFDTSGGGTLGFGSLTAATLGGLVGPGVLTLSNTAGAAVALVRATTIPAPSIRGCSAAPAALRRPAVAFSRSPVRTLPGHNRCRGRHAAVGLQRRRRPAANIINASTDSSGLILGGGTLAIKSTPSGPANTQQFNGLTLAARRQHGPTEPERQLELADPFARPNHRQRGRQRAFAGHLARRHNYHQHAYRRQRHLRWPHRLLRRHRLWLGHLLLRRRRPTRSPRP